MSLCLQVKYKEAGKQQAATSLFSKLPETLETKHAREASQLQSQVPERTAPQSRPSTRSDPINLALLLSRQKNYKDGGKKALQSPLYAQLPETSETQFAREMTQLQSEVNSLPPSGWLQYCHQAPPASS